MLRRFLLLAALVLATAAPALSQAAPTPAQRDQMARSVSALEDSLETAEKDLADLPPNAERTEARAEIRQLQQRLEAATADLATADERIQAERTAARTRRNEASDTVPDTAGANGAADGRRDERRTEPESDNGADVAGNETVPVTPLYKNPAVIGLTLALLALAGAGAWWFMRRQTSGGSGAPRSSIGPAQGLDLERRILGQTVTRREFQTLSESVQAQKAEIASLRTWMTDYYTKNEADKAVRVAAPPVAAAPAAPVLAPAEAAAAAFTDWCRRATPMMHRVEFFDRDLAERLPGATARAVLRDLNSQAEPVRFDGHGGASPAEFWLVAAGGESLLFPQPLNAMQFRDLTRVFEGSAAPAALVSVAPARVRDDGGTFSLVAPGRVA